MDVDRRRRFILLGLGLLLPLVLTGFCRPWGASRVPPALVWVEAERLGDHHALDPGFIYAVAFAESSFNSNAATARARGLMQITRPAWRRVSNRPFHGAWDWRQNMEASTAYMAVLRNELAQFDRFSYPLLAAAYHYGPTRISDHGYDITRLPPTNNRVYQALLSDRAPDNLPDPSGGVR